MEATVRVVIAVLAGLTVISSALAAGAQTEQPGRYTLSPADGGGVVRLDTQSGAMTLCRPERNEWTCKPMQGDDSRERQELDRLRAENQALKAEVRRLEDLVLPPERGTDNKPPVESSRPPMGFPLPTEEDVDRAFSTLERMWKRFQERMKDLEPKDKGTPL